MTNEMKQERQTAAPRKPFHFLPFFFPCASQVQTTPVTAGALHFILDHEDKVLKLVTVEYQAERSLDSRGLAGEDHGLDLCLPDNAVRKKQVTS